MAAIEKHLLLTWWTFKWSQIQNLHFNRFEFRETVGLGYACPIEEVKRVRWIGLHPVLIYTGSHQTRDRLEEAISLMNICFF